MADTKKPEETPKRLPKIQAAQKCAWCGRYLTGRDEIATFDGSDPDYQGWMCHAECNINSVLGTPESDTPEPDTPEPEPIDYEQSVPKD